MCFLYGICFKIGCLVLPLTCLAIVTPVLLHNGYLINDKSNNVYIKNLMFFCHFPINSGFLIQARLRSTKSVLWCIAVAKSAVMLQHHLTRWRPALYLPHLATICWGRSCQLRSSSLGVVTWRERYCLACSKENITHRNRSENQKIKSLRLEVVPSKR